MQIQLTNSHVFPSTSDPESLPHISFQWEDVYTQALTGEGSHAAWGHVRELIEREAITKQMVRDELRYRDALATR